RRPPSRCTPRRARSLLRLRRARPVARAADHPDQRVRRCVEPAIRDRLVQRRRATLRIEVDHPLDLVAEPHEYSASAELRYVAAAVVALLAAEGLEHELQLPQHRLLDLDIARCALRVRVPRR